MPRCSSTEKFAGYDEMEIEIEDESLTNGEPPLYSATVRAVRPCAECGEEFAEFTFDVETDEIACPTCGTEGLPACPTCEGTGDVNNETCSSCAGTGEDAGAEAEPIEFELLQSEASETDRNETHNAKGKPISYRYQRRFLGVEVVATIHCPKCSEDFDVTASDEVQASSFEILV